MKRILLSGFISLALLPGAGVAADAYYLNLGSTFNPQIDAINFTNKGLFQASGTLPYETFDTLNYANTVGSFSGSGTMSGTPGFRFGRTSSANGMRTMASSFFNDNGAVILANDPPAQSQVCDVAVVGPSYLLVSATNITVKSGTSGQPKASLIVGANGGMELTGKNVNLSTSGLEVLPVWREAQGSGNGDTNFIPDIAVSDLYWGRTNFTKDFRLNSGGLWDGVVAQAPGVAYPRVVPSGASGFALFNPIADAYTNTLGIMSVTVTNVDGKPGTVLLATNLAKGAIFVGAPAAATVSVGFSPGDNTGDTGLETAGVLLSLQFSNVVTRQSEPAYIYVQDRLGSGGTTGILTSVIGCPPFATARPANYLVSRLALSPGQRGNVGYPPDDFFLVSGNSDPLITDDGVTNATVQDGELAAYSAYLDNVVSRPLPVEGGTVTNLPGRIRINAENLNLTGTRIRSEGEVIIQSTHLISSSNAVIDCENLSFDLASTNGNLNVTSLSKDTVNRLTGSIKVWSAVWSNTALVILESYSYDTNNTPPATLAPVTNTVSMVFHTLMLDATAMQTTLPVTVHGFTSHSTNVVISDNMSVAESLLIDGQSLTLNGNLSISGVVPVVNPGIGLPPPGDPLQDWTFANAPKLLYFTNHGTFFIANDAHFGDDRSLAYADFVNTGTIDAWSLQVRSDYLQNNGALLSLGLLNLQSGSGKFENGSSSSGGDSSFVAGSLKFNNYAMTVNGGLYLKVTNALFDAGAGSANVFTVQNGFNLQIQPQTGDLLGTTFRTVAPNVPSVWIDHTWSAVDRGALPAGYTNNTALGKLVISSQSANPFFNFAGTGQQNGLYVDLIDLAALGTNYQNLIATEPNLVIYFAAATLGFTPPQTNGVPLQPEEYLDGKLDGHLRWVRDFAGPNSSVAVVSNGVSIKMNRALRNSMIIDSDGDGIPNGMDFLPFDSALVAQLGITNQPALTGVLSWNATAGVLYQVQAATNYAGPNWQTVRYYTNTAATNGKVTIQVPISSGSLQQFYRVGVIQP